ncbi:MAG: SAM-dependent chlorinase/fluorinase [Saprospiraceae bacterium]|nr:SAM-dependent chlorinase/fluorinase [Saprospiraceae bacterium]
MPLLTLTTDLGDRDFYAGALKGAVLRRAPEGQLVDISHHIKPFDIVQAAYVVQNVWAEFPEGTIHLIAVNCVYDSAYRFVALRRDGHFFLAPDNGLLSLLFDDIDPADLRLLDCPAEGHFLVKQVFAEAAAHLVSGLPFEELGQTAPPLLQRISLQPVVTPARLRGTVLHIDNFDNAVLNIRREVFEQAANGRSFSLFFRRNDPITRLCSNYCDVPVGDTLCLFNSAGYLEIAINMGRAASLLGLKVEDVVEVVFE